MEKDHHQIKVKKYASALFSVAGEEVLSRNIIAPISDFHHHADAIMHQEPDFTRVDLVSKFYSLKFMSGKIPGFRVSVFPSKNVQNTKTSVLYF